MSETQGVKEYRERIKTGQIVYFVEPNNALGARSPDFTLTVRKATVTQAEPGRNYPIVAIWQDLNSDPKGMGTSVAKYPWDLFTVEELQPVILVGKRTSGKSIDDLVKDAASNRRLAYSLSEIVRQRLKDDSKRQ